ncbi:hypothetical protein F3N42_09940 [Marinihelvus fidelis]|uniref:Lipoprotein n=1 Tax=Marinihelvus fidelis TaxID=2613842 RepID=A0A5N0TC19_9GAMM|nr:hypothetical protein [Marinihelvus fidelis]KAA9131627.1 hypothetical protein F3N42_09940 [Marinihelvus fidelis]
MTRRGGVLALALLGATLLAACGDSGGPDPCRDHYQVHPGHADAVARLTLDFDDNGSVRGRFSPSADLPAGALEQLAATGALFTAGDAGACSSGVEMADGGEALEFDMTCEGEDVIKTLNVTAFDTLPALDEVLVRVTTPATTKTFAILRACPAPLYRLQ